MKQWLFNFKTYLFPLFSLLLCWVLFSFPLNSIEFFTYDLRVRFSSPTPLSHHIVLVNIDLNDINNLKKDPSLSLHKNVLKKIQKGSPQSIIYILDILEDVSASDKELKSFAKEAEKIENLYLNMNRKRLKDRIPTQKEMSLLRFSKPLENIKTHMAWLTADQKSFAKDGVTRRIIVSNDNIPFSHYNIARPFNKVPSFSDYRGIFPFHSSQQLFIDFRPKGTYPSYSFLSILKDSFNTQVFKNKIVLIGRDTNAVAEDYRATPYSKSTNAMATTEVHANMLDTLILNSAPKRSPKDLNFALTFLIILLTSIFIFQLRPTSSIFSLLGLLASLWIISYIAYEFFRYWLIITQPSLAVFLCYYFFIPYRLIVESRKSWKYSRENKLLTEVEELKTNFLRMMSHDLKTPLARIQGMVGVIRRNSRNLPELKASALNNIEASAEELSHFISSILDLSRVEGNVIKLNLKTKDIHLIIEKAINSCNFLLQEKKITISKDFSPIFSFKIDQELIYQVLVNLIENGIKYSPEGSKIVIQTQGDELKKKVRVFVKDSGIGIDKEEQARVFDKFYRSSQVTHEKGSGLGLYLAHYFTRLHGGQLHVKSQLNKGSIFILELPIQ